jgi:hypothetical protein
MATEGQWLQMNAHNRPKPTPPFLRKPVNTHNRHILSHHSCATQPGECKIATLNNDGNDKDKLNPHFSPLSMTTKGQWLQMNTHNRHKSTPPFSCKPVNTHNRHILSHHSCATQ